ncbi:SDR family NAD(P)-dependent oxidoreductase, partial [Streptomyces sp. NPDC048179]|uniref:SDR family NAD(P)-dependent oxidoreductase n=1 Tax=Streptomyces sp. NPDC048179 TaxID=3365506 RepID=UPI003715C165
MPSPRGSIAARRARRKSPSPSFRSMGPWSRARARAAVAKVALLDPGSGGPATGLSPSSPGCCLESGDTTQVLRPHSDRHSDRRAQAYGSPSPGVLDMSFTWLITGATSGFGRLVAERALTTGAHVIAVGRRADRLAELSDRAPRGQVT